MLMKPIAVLALLCASAAVEPVSAQLKKVRFSTSAISISELPFKVAQLKGFWREEGLDVEAILIRGAVGMQALLGGSVDYTSASGSTIAAAVRGLPVKLVFVSSAKPQFDLMAQPSIRSVQELKGKVIGISSRGGSNDLMTQMILQKNGLAPNKDVTLIIVGGQEESYLALRAGRIAAALMTPPRPFMLQRDGFHRIAYAGDYMPTYPNGGIGVTDEYVGSHYFKKLTQLEMTWGDTLHQLGEVSARMQDTADSTEPKPVTMMTSGLCARVWICFRRSVPSPSGSRISTKIRSKLSRPSNSWASAIVEAAATS